MMKYISAILIALIALTPVSTIHAEVMTARLKDIANIVEARDNQLMGFGLVVGLRNTGDTKNSLFTNKALTSMLSKLGIQPDKKNYTSRNVAAVMVTAKLPAFVKKGQRIPVNVSSVGDARSLSGGTLILTQLKGADFQTYAVAQGSVIVGGVLGQARTASYAKNQTTVGRIPNGAIVEREVPITLRDKENITIVLNESNYITASRTANAIRQYGFKDVKAVDANTIKVKIPSYDPAVIVDMIARLENIQIAPDNSSKVVINSRTGTVVIGEMVKLFPVAVTHGSISIKVDDRSDDDNYELPFVDENPESVTVTEPKSKVVYLAKSATLSSLVEALNKIGATPKDLISILQALKSAGALIGNIHII